MQLVLNDDEALANIAANVSRLLDERGVSYSEMARRCSVEGEYTAYPSHIERIAKGRNMPGVGLLSRVAEILGVTIDDLISPPPNRPRKKSA